MLDNCWPAVCVAVVLGTFGAIGACAGLLYVVIRPAKGRRDAHR